MPKVPLSTRVEEQVAKRLERVAAVDRRTLANIVEICVEEYLPQLEAQLEAELATKSGRRPTTEPQPALALNDPAPPSKYPRSKLPPGKRGIAKEKEN
jgi:hypothetical protein